MDRGMILAMSVLVAAFVGTLGGSVLWHFVLLPHLKRRQIQKDIVEMAKTPMIWKDMDLSQWANMRSKETISHEGQGESEGKIRKTE